MQTATALSVELFARLASRIIEVLPEVAKLVDSETLEELADPDNEDLLLERLNQGLRGTASESSVEDDEEEEVEEQAESRPALPAEGEVFELTLEPVTGLGMVSSDGYNPEGWEFTGQEVAEPQTKQFKLVKVGYCRDLDEVRAKLEKFGTIPQGQWREAFKTSYPSPDGQGPIGFADPSWVDPDGDVGFPVLDGSGGGWGSHFDWADDDYYEGWRWLVESK